MQEALAETYVALGSYFQKTEGYSNKEIEMVDPNSKEALMTSLQDQIYKEMEIDGLAKFTAYCNKQVKVVFEDRTIIRMIYG